MFNEFIQSSMEDSCFPVWSPYSTRFSTSEVYGLLDTNENELRALSRIDASIFPSEDIDDSSVRRQYYNFWTMARIGFHKRLTTCLLGSNLKDEYLSDIADELEEYLGEESDGQIHLRVIKAFGERILYSSEIAAKSDFILRNSDSLTECEVRLTYWLSVFHLGLNVASLLSEYDLGANGKHSLNVLSRRFALTNVVCHFSSRGQRCAS
jgi:hypothetical protein